jgi:hypothetical protein
LKDKINELGSHSKNKNTRNVYRTINEFKKGYQPRSNLVKDERGDLLADPHKSLNRWKNYFCQLLNVQGAGGVRQTEMHTAEPFVPKPSASEVEVIIGKLESYNPPAVGQIIKLTIVITEAYHCCQLHIKFYPNFFCLG